VNVVLVEEELSAYTPSRDTIVTIGVFDGVHLGHVHLIRELLRQASECDLMSIALTFQQHPENLFRAQESRLPLIMDIPSRIKLLKESGISTVVPLSFTQELAGIDALSFVKLLKKHLKMQGLVIGSDFALGKNREGNTDRLKELGREHGFSVTVVEPLVMEGETVSSTTIRKTLTDGDIDKVARFMGRRYRLKGEVIPGDGRGVSLGFPTANLKMPSDYAIPADGVYSVIIYIGEESHAAVTNIGNNPTFNNNEKSIESFILKYDGNLYGQNITIEFISRIRDEIKFSNVEALKKQIAEDVEKTKNLLLSTGVLW
jgi:riboflavin kinase / FMN adenylyltransferase